MDWLIYHLVEEVTTHYWYAWLQKECGFINNLAQEFIVVCAVKKAMEILDYNVKL